MHTCGLKTPAYLYGRHFLSGHQRRRSRYHHSALPAAVVVGRLLPSCFFEARIVFVSGVNIVDKIRSCRRFPRVVRANFLHLAVVKLNTQQAGHTGTVAPSCHVEAPGGYLSYRVVETVTQHGRNDIGATVQHRRNIIHAIQVATVVVGVTGVQQIGRNGTPVQLKCAIGGCAVIEPCALDTMAVDVEHLAEHGRRLEVAVA